MPRIIKSGLIQVSLPKTEGEGTIPEILEAMVQKHIPFIEEAGTQGVQILCFQEIFNTPYFCPGQDAKWYSSAETVPGPTTERMAEYAKKYNMVIIVPVYEKEQAGVLELTWASIVKITFRIPVDFGKSFFLSPETLAIRYFKRSMQKWVCTFVTTAIFQTGQDVWG